MMVKKTKVNKFTSIVSRLQNNDRTLTALNLSYAAVADENLMYLTNALIKNTHLTKLNLSFNRIDSQSLSYLLDIIRQNRSLCVLILTSNQLTDDDVRQIAEAIKENKQITRLDLSENKISAQGETYLIDIHQKTQANKHKHVRLKPKTTTLAAYQPPPQETKSSAISPFFPAIVVPKKITKTCRYQTKPTVNLLEIISTVTDALAAYQPPPQETESSAMPPATCSTSFWDGFFKDHGPDGKRNAEEFRDSLMLQSTAQLALDHIKMHFNKGRGNWRPESFKTILLHKLVEKFAPEDKPIQDDAAWATRFIEKLKKAVPADYIESLDDGYASLTSLNGTV